MAALCSTAAAQTPQEQVDKLFAEGRDLLVNKNDAKAACEKFSSGVQRDLRARAAQGALLYLGYQPGDPDGVVGQNTRRAIEQFRRDAQLGAGGDLDDAVFAAIMKKAGF